MMMTKTEPITGLALLRMPFPAHQISKLPKPTKAQTDAVRNDFKKGIRCQLCGAWHHPDVVHLDYVGHAALTDRLLDADPDWDWEPFAVDERGLPAFDKDGCLWIKLTVCGKTRIGVGDADGKTGGNARKEAIGDALRNAAMRFGAALDLWHKGDLHIEEETPEGGNAASKAPPKAARHTNAENDIARILALVQSTNTNIPAMLKHLKITLKGDNLELLTGDQYFVVLDALENKLAVMAKAASDKQSTAEMLDDEIRY
jgi:hypothetical protein